MQMVEGNGGNQFRQYARKNAGHLNGYNAVQNVRNQVAQNPRVQNIGNQNGLISVQGNGNQNQIRNGNLVAVRAEGNAAGHNGNQIRCYNYRGVGHFARDCTVRPRRRDAAYLHTKLLISKKEEAGIQLQAEEKHKANVSKNETQKKYRPKVSKPKNVGTHESLATPKPRKPRFLLRWSPTGKMFDSAGKLVAPSNSESHVDCSNGDNACTSNAMEPKIKRFPNSISLLSRLSRFVCGASIQVVPST
nr:hypothetical protein [Tanacetum cinerariifolium]